MLQTRRAIAAIAVFFLSSACGSPNTSSEHSSRKPASGDHTCRYEEASTSFSEGFSVKINFDEKLETAAMETIVMGKTGNLAAKPQTIRTTLRLKSVISSSPLTALYQGDDDGASVSLKASISNNRVNLAKVDFKRDNISASFFIECP